MAHAAEASEHSLVERDLADYVRTASGGLGAARSAVAPTSPAPTYVERMPSQPALPRFASWDPAWYSGGHSGDGHAYTTRRPDSDDILPSADDAASRAASREWQPVYDNPEPSGHFLPARYRPESDGESDAGEEIASRRKRGKKPLSARKKAERVRMLEKAFGPSSRSVAPTRLAPRGTKKRLAVRCVQILLTFAIVLGSLGGVFLSHPPQEPPPAGKIPTWVLYVLSVLSLLSTLWLHGLRRCCASQPAAEPSTYGRFVLMSGGYDEEMGGCCGGSRKKRRQQSGRQPVVNLIVDPAAFGQFGRRQSTEPERQQERRSSYASEKRAIRRPSSEDGRDTKDGEHSDTETFALPELEDPLQSRVEPLPPRRPPRPFSSVKLVWFDGVLGVLWLAEVVWAVGFSPACPPGTANGFCDGYNGALASGVFLALACFIAVYLGVRDLRCL